MEKKRNFNYSYQLKKSGSVNSLMENRNKSMLSVNANSFLE